MEDGPSLNLIENLKASLDAEEADSGNVVDLGAERLLRGRDSLTPDQVTPQEVLKLAMEDCSKLGNISKCYVTLIVDEGDERMGTINYRAQMTRTEEIAFRQLGLQEQIDNWRVGGSD